MSNPQTTNQDFIKSFGSISGAEPVVPKLRNRTDSAVVGFNIGSSRFNDHKEYLSRVQSLIDQNGKVFSNVKRHIKKNTNREFVAGTPIYLDMNTADATDINNSVYQFNRMKSMQDYFVFDIETIGNSTERAGDRLNAYSLSEVSIMNFRQNGQINHGNSLNLLMRIDENTKNKVQELLNKVGKDRYKFNALTDSEQRQLVDLMRYSTDAIDGDKSFKYSTTSQHWIKAGGQSIRSMNITHNSVVEERFMDKFGRLDVDRVMMEWDKNVVRMQSGLKTLTSKNLISQTDGAMTINQFLKDNQEKLFMSYNGYQFDKPLLKDFIIKETMNRDNQLRKAMGLGALSPEQVTIEREKLMGSSHLMMKNHLDLYRMINSVYGDVGELEKAMTGKNKHQLMNKQLQTLREFLPEHIQKQFVGAAHNAEADNLVLNEVFKHLRKDLDTRISATKHIDQMQQVDTRLFSKGNEMLTYGSRLVSQRGIVTSDEFDKYSFLWENQGETYGSPDYARGRSIIQREALYEFRGIEKMKDIEGDRAYRMHLYNVIDDEHAFIVRTGHNAEAELAKFVNQNFTSEKYRGFDRFADQNKGIGLYKQMSRERKDDRARRYRSSMFTTDNYKGGLSLNEMTGEIHESTAKGFGAAKANFQAASLYQQFLDEKNGALNPDGTYRDGYSRKGAANRLQAELNKIFHGNQGHIEKFFAQQGRLRDELPFYQEAIKSIEQKYAVEIDDLHNAALEDVYAKQQGERKWKGESSYELLDKNYIYKMNEVQQKRNFAIASYHNQVEALLETISEDAGMKKVKRLNERWEVRFTDPKSPNGRERVLDFSNYENAKRSIQSFIKQTTHKDIDKLPHIRREGFNTLVDYMHRDNVIDSKAYTRLRKFIDAKDLPGSEAMAQALYNEVTARQQKIIRDTRKLHSNLPYEDVMNLAFGENSNSPIKRVTEQLAVSLERNEYIKQALTIDGNKSLIQHALDRANSFIPEVSYTFEGTKNNRYMNLPSHITDYLDALDRPRSHSILKADNRSAVERVFNQMTNTFGGNYSTFMTLNVSNDGKAPTVDFWAVNKERGSNVLNMLERGETPANAMRFTMPLINEQGFMRVGNTTVNANMVTKLVDVNGERKVTLVSSQDALADILVSKIGKARDIIEDPKRVDGNGGFDAASNFMNNRVKDYVTTLSGSEKDSKLDTGDTAKIQGNVMDFRKQQHVLFADAYIRDLMDRGYGGFQLEESRLRQSAFRFNSAGQRVLKDYLSIDDLNESDREQALKLRAAWWESNRTKEMDNVFLSLGSVKSSNADKFMQALDNQAYMPMGMAHDTIRDPMSQSFGAEIIDEEMRARLQGVRGVNTSLTYMSAMQHSMALESRQTQGHMMLPDTIQVKSAYMTDDQILKKVGQLMENNDTRAKLSRLKVINLITEAEVKQQMENAKRNAFSKGRDLSALTEEQLMWQENYVKKIGDQYYKVDSLKLPNTYEQQAAISSELYEAMKLRNSRRFASDHKIEFNEELLERYAARMGVDRKDLKIEDIRFKAGDHIGNIIHANGYIEEIKNNGKDGAHLSGLKIDKSGNIREIKLNWQEDAFKAFSFAEKMTLQPVNRDLITMLTGDADVALIHAGEVFKHKEHGHFLARVQGQLSEYMRQSSGDAALLNKQVEALKNAKLGLDWDAENGVLVDRTYVKPAGYTGGQDEFSVFKRGGNTKDYAKRMNKLLQTQVDGDYLFKGLQNKFFEDIQIGVEQFRIAKISNTAKQVGDSAKKFLGYNVAGEAVYGKRDGTSIGHREMRTIRSQGMTETLNYLTEKMKAQSQKEKSLSGMSDGEFSLRSNIDHNYKITLAQELDNMIYAVEAGIGRHSDSFAITRRVNDFLHQLPTKNYDPLMYHHTAFDMNRLLQESLEEKAKEQAEARFGKGYSKPEYKSIFDEVKAAHEQASVDSPDRIRGFWLELPTALSADRDATTPHPTEVTPTLYDKSKYGNREDATAQKRKMDDIKTNKIFVPFMHATQDKGQRFLNEIQRDVRAIIEKASYANRAEDYTSRANHVAELSDMVSNYYRKIVSETTSSKGYVANNINQLRMENSASGLYKLMTESQSNEWQNRYGYFGEFTIMNKKDALAMGLSETDVSDIIGGKEVYVGQVRYPSFHDGAMQYNRLFIDDKGDVRPGEFRTSTLASILKNADSDGDYGFMFYAKDGKVQSEMKAFQETRITKYKDAFDKYMGEIGKGGLNDFNNYLHNMNINGGDHIRELLGDKVLDIRHANTSQEVVAKVWKGIVGRVSNLNYDIQQMAADMLERGMIDDKQYAQTMEFGKMLEQKIIDSKHGAEGVASDIINKLNSGQWDIAGRLMREHYTKVNKDTGLEELLQTADGRTVKMSEFDVGNAFEAARETVIKGTQFYKTEPGKLNVDGFDIGKSSGFSGTLQDFAEISRNSQKAQEIGMFSRHNTFLNLMHTHLGIDQGVMETSAQRHAQATAIDLSNEANTIDGKAAQYASEQQRKLFESVSANPILDITEGHAPSGLGKGKMKGAALAVGALVGYNIVIGNSSPPQYNQEGSQQFKRQYTPEEIYGEPSTQAASSTAGMMSDPAAYEYKNRQFQNHQVDSAAPGRAEEYSQQQFANIMIQAKGMSRLDDGLAGLVNQAMMGSGMTTGATNIQMSTTDNTRQLNRIWYRDQVENNYM